MKHQTSAPANIALIKYMGKSDSKLNIPSNASLSYTLSHLKTFVELETNTNEDRWEPLNTIEPQSLIFTNKKHKKINMDFQLSNAAQERYINFLKKLKSHFNVKENFIIRSKNNFPANCGLASSASSFAALTKCAIEIFSKIQNKELPSLEFQAKLSQSGSGSSCRSFFSPWCLWDVENISDIELPYPDLYHLVIIVSQQNKPISSSKAHQLVTTSALYKNRHQRATDHLDNLIQTLKQKQWQDAKDICWQEFWDMHALFETACPNFGYMTPDSLKVLKFSRDYWSTREDGPIITMDAGANVHLLFHKDQRNSLNDFWREFENQYILISNTVLDYAAN